MTSGTVLVGSWVLANTCEGLAALLRMAAIVTAIEATSAKTAVSTATRVHLIRMKFIFGRMPARVEPLVLITGRNRLAL